MITIPRTWTPVAGRGTSAAQPGSVVRSYEWRVLELAAQHTAGVRLPQHPATVHAYRVTTGATVYRRRMPVPAYASLLYVWHASRMSSAYGTQTDVTATWTVQTTGGVAIDTGAASWVQGDEYVVVDALLEWASPAAATSAAEVDLLLSVTAETNDRVETLSWGAVALPLTPPWGDGTI